MARVTESLYAAARELAAMCVCVAAMETVVGDRRYSEGFRSVCALAVAVRALRLIARLLGTA